MSPNQESEVGGVEENLVLSYLISGPEITLTDGLSVLKSLLTSLGINYSLKPCKYISVCLRGRPAYTLVIGILVL